MFNASDKATLIGGNKVLSSYGPDGLRSEKTGVTGSKFFAYDGLAPVIETSNNSSVTAVNTFGPAGLISRSSGGVSTFYTPDERGNVAQRLNSAGAVASSDLYNAYGKRLAGGGASGDPYGFGGMAGYYTDGETGLSLLGERFYDPSVSRFLTRDPIGYAGGMNLYCYAGNNPVMNSDPSGLDFYNDPDEQENGPIPGSGAAMLGGEINGGYNAGGGVGQRVAAGSPERTDLAQSVRSVPVVGGVLAGYSAITGCDPVAGSRESNAARGWDGAQAALEALPIVGHYLDEAGGWLKGLRRGPCNLCLTGDTPVQMADGSTKLIRDIQVGDQVLSRDPDTGKDEAKTVTATIERHAPSVVDVVLHDAKTGASEMLTCTPEHPLFVQGQGWVEAGSVGIGSSIVSRAGSALQVTSLTWKQNKAQELAVGSAGSSLGGYTVYNLTVEDDHTFFVGTANGGAWVHNGYCKGRLIPGKGGSLTRGPRISYQEALDMVKKGIDVIADSGREARSIAKSASPTNKARNEIHGSPQDGFFRHWHAMPRWDGDGHIFY